MLSRHPLLPRAVAIALVAIGYFALGKVSLLLAIPPGYATDDVDRERLRLHVDVVPVALELAQAVPFGLLLNELLTNALRHAFPRGRAGNLLIRLACGDGRHCELTVGDDGVGLPPEFAPGHGPSLGLHLVSTLARQLGGEIAVQRAAGTVFTLRFQIRQSKAIA